MLNLCKYKNLLGKTDTGIHSYRIFNVAIADVLMTIIFAYAISYFFKYPFLLTLGLLFLLGIFMHRIFCVRTTFDKILFPNVDD